MLEAAIVREKQKEMKTLQLLPFASASYKNAGDVLKRRTKELKNFLNQYFVSYTKPDPKSVAASWEKVKKGAFRKTNG